MYVQQRRTTVVLSTGQISTIFEHVIKYSVEHVNLHIMLKYTGPEKTHSVV